jgi:MoaA/NifB/PqqE/SkfB family radical SAM enzyme
VLLFANVRLITAHLADLFARIRPLVAMEITVYGMRRESYEAVTRVPGLFARFMDGLNLLFESGVRVRLKAMAIQSNLHEQQAIAAFCRERPTICAPGPWPRLGTNSSPASGTCGRSAVNSGKPSGSAVS